MGKRKGDKMLTVQEAAAKLGASVKSVRVWVWQGRFAGARKETTPMGEYWLIPESSLEGVEVRPPGRPPKPKTEKKGKPKGN
jgi:hypothetical protein